MAGPKTSAEKSREDEKNAVADDMFGGSFCGLEGMEATEKTPVEVGVNDICKVSLSKASIVTEF